MRPAVAGLEQDHRRGRRAPAVGALSRACGPSGTRGRNPKSLAGDPVPRVVGMVEGCE